MGRPRLGRLSINDPAYYPLFLFNGTATTEIYTLSLHDALPIYHVPQGGAAAPRVITPHPGEAALSRSEEHTSELQSPVHLVCRLLLEKKKPPNSHNRLHPQTTRKRTLAWCQPALHRYPHQHKHS